jgi:hypothetical protein
VQLCAARLDLNGIYVPSDKELIAALTSWKDHAKSTLERLHVMFDPTTMVSRHFIMAVGAFNGLDSFSSRTHMRLSEGSLPCSKNYAHLTKAYCCMKIV